MTVPLIPRPDHLDVRDGTLDLDHGIEVAAAPAAWRRLVLRRVARWGLLDPDGVPLRVVEDAALAPGAHRLEISGDGVELAVADRPGLAHGLGVVEQLLPAAASGPGGLDAAASLPLLSEASAPAHGHRGAMLDVARHFFGAGTIAALIGALSVHGYNRLHLHLSDDQGWRVESLIEPRLTQIATHRPGTRFGPGGPYDPTPHGGHLTLAELRSLSDLAREHGMELVAEIDLPGHSSALRAALPELDRPGARTRVLDTVGWGGSSVRPLPASVAILDALLGELVDQTGISHVHLGGDECDMSWWLDDPDVDAHAARLGYDRPEQLHGWLLRELGTRLEQRGVQVLAWDEAFITDGLTPDTVVTAWRGHAVAERVARSHRLVRAPLFPTYFNFDQSTDADEPRAQGGPITLDDVMDFELAPAAWPEQSRANVIGGQFQVWSEWVTTEAELWHAIFPRALAMAEVLWRGGVDDHDDLVDRIGAAEGRLRARGIQGRPLSGSLPWQQGGLGRRHRATGNDIEATRQWVESVSDRA